MKIRFYSIYFKNTNERIKCRYNESISDAMRRFKGNHPIVGCRNGGCGICKIRVLKGNYSTGKMSKSYISDYELGKGYSLACRTYPFTDMEVEYIGRI